MSAERAGPHELRVLVLPPAGGTDSDSIGKTLTDAGVEAVFCADADDLCREIGRGAGAVLVAEEALTAAARSAVAQKLSMQPHWSDVPLILLADDAAPGELAAGLTGPFHPLILRRPVRQEDLDGAVRSALAARRLQYEVRNLLTEADRTARQRDEFLAMLGHELRNPLSAINNAVQVLNRVGSPDVEAAEMREMIERQTSHLTRLVDDLLDVSRVSSGQITLQREHADLNDVVAQCVHACEAQVAARRHEMRVIRWPSPAVVDGDPVRLEQVVNNLLTNAIKYTPAGGSIEISVEVEPRPPQGLESCGGPQAVVRVRDTGMGIEPEMLGRVFDTFAQADRSLDRAQGGVGLGLTLVRRLVEMHGGTVRASSEGLGRGSTFEVRLPALAEVTAGSRAYPAAPAATPSPGQQAVKPDKPLRARRVLIVEDGPDARRALGRLLELWGHKVELAEDGTRGVERAIASRPDVALIDIGLPGLNGYEVAKRVRQALGDRVRLIALTGYGQPDDHDRTREAGFDEHLVKPVNPRLLSRLLAADAHPTSSAHGAGGALMLEMTV
ncbi:MAG TPA: ATP-binding protein [Tepidisphaeraceae bacterium]|nr:ATP-binding protein [Tepidisphaeraceae bacterium]